MRAIATSGQRVWVTRTHAFSWEEGTSDVQPLNPWHPLPAGANRLHVPCWSTATACWWLQCFRGGHALSTPGWGLGGAIKAGNARSALHLLRLLSISSQVSNSSMPLPMSLPHQWCAAYPDICLRCCLTNLVFARGVLWCLSTSSCPVALVPLLLLRRRSPRCMVPWLGSWELLI